MVAELCGRHAYRKANRAWITGLLFCLALLSAPLQAQSGNGQVSGLVTDSSGAAMAGATVIATNTATNIPYRTVTNRSGVYVLSQMVPGPYTVQASKQGFAPSSAPASGCRPAIRWR